MKSKFKDMISLLITIAVVFAVVYLFVLLGGWKLFESGDPVAVEIGVSVILGILAWILIKLYVLLNSRIDKLENKIEQIENDKKQ